MSSKATNLKSTYWATSQGVAGYAGSSNFGILSATGTHALAMNGKPIVYKTKKVAALVAPHANALVNGGNHSWLPVWSSRSAVLRPSSI